MEWQHAAAFPDADFLDLKCQVEIGLHMTQEAMTLMLQSRREQLSIEIDCDPCADEIRALHDHINLLDESSHVIEKARAIIAQDLSNRLQSDSSALMCAYQCYREAVDAVLSEDKENLLQDALKSLLADAMTCASVGFLCEDLDAQIHDFVKTVLSNILYLYEMSLNAEGFVFDYGGLQLSEEFARRKRLLMKKLTEVGTSEITEVTAEILHAQRLLDFAEYPDASDIVEAISALCRASLLTTTCPSTVDTSKINEACHQARELLAARCLHDVPQHLRGSRNEFLASVKYAFGGFISEDEKSRVLNAVSKLMMALPSELRFFKSESARQGRARHRKRSRDVPRPPGLLPKV